MIGLFFIFGIVWTNQISILVLISWKKKFWPLIRSLLAGLLVTVDDVVYTGAQKSIYYNKGKQRRPLPIFVPAVLWRYLVI